MKSSWITPELMRDFEIEQTTACRLSTAEAAWAERFGHDVLISYKSASAREQLTKDYFQWAERVGFRHDRIFGRFLPRDDACRAMPTLLQGNATKDLRTVATERALNYEIDFGAGYSVGLFPDQRENRQYVRRVASNRVLNCFAYTCSFSVAAASAGSRTVSIDLSRKSLERGRRNFELNSLPLTGHRFIADDVFEVVPRMARRGDKFDLIVLDPPTFSRSPSGRTFEVKSDFEHLLLSALDVAERDARILLSTNCTGLNVRSLEAMGRFCLKASRRAGRIHRQPTPPDYANSAAASTVWLTVS